MINGVYMLEQYLRMLRRMFGIHRGALGMFRRQRRKRVFSTCYLSNETWRARWRYEQTKGKGSSRP
jgi:hypothetical protein